ncbi:hypothetical protein HMPREF0322_02394 [Desulfitobacterium hafniense DP7]|uniref:Uncharacterized protein n=3 Tax=root TaxID=1 RepID=G9XN53_DESHA|nr:hypothetical protein HMPREF0322_02394 [Desulfitobacterium hafniense DP7]
MLLLGTKERRLSMSEEDKVPSISPGTCLPWEQVLKDYGPPAGDESLIKDQWEQLDAFAYLYLWWWVQR